jgi:hypothetical protein
MSNTMHAGGSAPLPTNDAVTITLLESEWLTAIDALRDRAEQTAELASEVGDADLVQAAHDYALVAEAIASEVNRRR